MDVRPKKKEFYKTLHTDSGQEFLFVFVLIQLKTYTYKFNSKNRYIWNTDSSVAFLIPF